VGHEPDLKEERGHMNSIAKGQCLVLKMRAIARQLIGEQTTGMIDNYRFPERPTAVGSQTARSSRPGTEVGALNGIGFITWRK
jgi:hypothetical protein